MTEANIVLLGDYGVGKTCLASIFSNNPFDVDSYVPTVLDTVTLRIEAGNNSYEIKIFDTSGQQDFLEITSVEAVSENITRYLEEKHTLKLPVIICGNKLDLVNKYQNKYVPLKTVEEKVKKATKRHITYFECSVFDEMFKTGENEGKTNLILREAIKQAIQCVEKVDTSNKCTIL